VVAFFGVPKAHEDDPVRAIRTAREINELVDAMSHQFESKVGKPLSMHTGINTGLVVTGEVTVEKGILGSYRRYRKRSLTVVRTCKAW